MKKGQIVVLKDTTWGGITLLRYHSSYNETHFNAYLHFDMSSEHSVIEDLSEIMSTEFLTELLKKETHE